jgi:hypothetical protein
MARGDVDFVVAHDDDFANMAIVGDEWWSDRAYAFVGKGLRATEIEFFPYSSLKEAER